MKTDKRLLNIELLRIVTMLLITLWHFHAWYILPHVENIDSITQKAVGLTMSFLPFHVNVFILISGYFGIKSSLKGCVQIYTMCLFYVGLDCIFNECLGNDFDFKKLIFPISHGGWWFINIYFCLLLIAPFINRAVKNLTRKEWYVLLCVFAIIDCYFGFLQHMGTLYHYGYDLLNMSTVYVVGRFMSSNYCSKPKMPKAMFLFASFIMLKVILQYTGKILNIQLLFGSNDYCNPLLIMAAVYFFFIFFNIKIQKSKVILFFSKSVIGVYLLTSCSITQPLLAKVYMSFYFFLGGQLLGGIVSVFLLLILIFIAITFIDKIRLFICMSLNNWLYAKICSCANVFIK